MLSLPFDDVTDAELDRELVRRGGFSAFLRLAWNEVPAPRPMDYVDTWHVHQIARHLEAVSAGECRNLIVCVPPGTGKTRAVSVLWPAWDWIKHPRRAFMAATYSQDLTHDSALACRSLLRSKWFSDRWPEVRLASGADDRETISDFAITAGGRRRSVTVSGQITGFHANIQIIDDPTKPEDIKYGGTAAGAALERTWGWWQTTMSSRRIGEFSRVIIMQRLCEGDLVDRILNSKGASQWTVVMMPMRFEPERAFSTPWGADERTHAGELLCPALKTEDEVIETEDTMGARVAAAQLQQRPAPPSGNIIKREWFSERWTTLPDNLTLVQSWDTTVKGGASGDFVAGQLWGYSAGKYYLIDRIHDRMGFPETCACIVAWRKKYPKAFGILIENAATGPAIEQTLKDRVTGIILVKPQDIGGDKEARMNAVAPMAEAGNIVLPAQPWAEDVLNEWVTFPNGRHDDECDAMTQALLHLHTRSHARYLDAMKAVRSGKLDTMFRRSA